MDESVKKAITWLKDADYILIGAGMSTEAGNDYTDEMAFVERFPAMVKRGYKMPYEFVGKHDWEPSLQWGYMAAFVNLVRFSLPPQKVYQDLLCLVNSKKNDNSNSSNYFVITPNADGMFERYGFSEEKLYTIQGDFKYMQCAKPCTPNVWLTKPVIDEILPVTSKETQEIIDSSKIPKCKYCGGKVALNVRGGNYFLEQPYAEQAKKFNEFIQFTAKNNKKLVILEIGAGYNTPTVIRLRMENIALQHPSAKLIRVNFAHDEIHSNELSENAVGLPLATSKALSLFREAVCPEDNHNKA